VRRNLKHALRYPSVSLSTAVVPIILLLLFVYVFGGEIGAGISGHGAGRGSYVNYLAPGSIIQTMVSVVLVTAVALLAGFRPAARPRGGSARLAS
jgi:ABC-2 type transport system permease protein